jgi:hypothetical protein
MLEPQDRRLLLDALRPPDGYEFDEGIGTTFTLDLLALLTAPLGFTMLELQDSRPGEIGEADALLLLKTLRRYADRLTIFCQAGRIALPRGQGRLLASLERSVVEVMAPTPGGVFHPKVWALRYVGADESVRYKVLVLTRNLTFDRSWDTMLVLEGELQRRVNAIARNHPLGDFVKALPGMALRADETATARAARLEHELRRVAFHDELPKGMTDMAFHVLGLPGASRREPLRGRIDRLLVISPFVSATRLDEMAPEGAANILVARHDELDRIPASRLGEFEEVYSLSSQAVETLEGEAEESAPQAPEIGLHAKTYVADAGWEARIWTGSANATPAAFGKNVEFLVELVGPKKEFGIDAVLARRDGVIGLRDLLVPWTAPSEPATLSDDECAAEDLLDAVRLAVAGARWIARVEPVGTLFDLALQPEQPTSLPDGVIELRVHPIMLPESAAKPVDAAAGAVFTGLTLAAVTSFLGFVARVRVGEVELEARFVVNADLRGAPADRREAILRSLLRDRRQVLRFLMLLLADDDQVLSGEVGASVLGAGASATGSAEGTEALLETLLRTLHRHPERLDEVSRVLEDLERTETETEPLVPAGLRAVFDPILAARGSGR